MVINEVLRQLLTDKLTLQEYANGKTVKFKTIKRRAEMRERMLDKKTPDHFYKNVGNFYMGEFKSLNELLSKGLINLSKSYLEDRAGLVYVKSCEYENWQSCITFGAPLVYLSAFLSEKFTGQITIENVKTFYETVIDKNVKSTLLLPPYLPQMESKIENGGLHDLHIHLNGSTETDILLQNLLDSPEAFYINIKKEYFTQKVKEQYEDDDELITPLDIYYFLKKAQFLRTVLAYMITELFGEAYLKFAKKYFKNSTTDEMLSLDFYKHKNFDSLASNPLYQLYGNDYYSLDFCEKLKLETLLNVFVIKKLQASKNEFLASLYHYYLLIIGKVNKYVVQQVPQFGFDQFQKITLNNFRENEETQYKSRFFQLNGRKSNYMRFLEGRFSVKKSVEANYKLIDKIYSTYYKNEKNNFQLKLVAHFIKGKEKTKKGEYPNSPVVYPKIMFKQNRIDYWLQALALEKTLKMKLKFIKPSPKGENKNNVEKYLEKLNPVYKYEKISNILTGIDAAANELETPPEVFSPVFRYLRSRGVQYVTYHAGEDFHHLIGGLRAIYEAVEFLDMRSGDRIGHATAAGINPELWAERVNGSLYIEQGEWMDDLILAHQFIVCMQDSTLITLLPKIEKEIHKLSLSIYRKAFNSYEYFKAWELRKYCPFSLFAAIVDDSSDLKSVWWRDEFERCKELKIPDNPKELISMYNNGKYRDAYKKILEVKTLDIFSIEDLRKLQNHILKILHDKEIILESLPTSNVRISFYENMKEHHLWRWLKIEANKEEKDLPMPSVVLGTDDPGIFATNIYNEYAHVFTTLVNHFKKTEYEAIQIIDQLEHNSNVYKFK